MEIEVPQITIAAESVPGTGEIALFLIVMVSGMYNKIYLCLASQNYQDIARQLDKRINEAGREARRAQAQNESGLLVVKDLPDSLKNGGGHGRGIRQAQG